MDNYSFTTIRLSSDTLDSIQDEEDKKHEENSQIFLLLLLSSFFHRLFKFFIKPFCYFSKTD